MSTEFYAVKANGICSYDGLDIRPGSTDYKLGDDRKHALFERKYLESPDIRQE